MHLGAVSRPVARVCAGNKSTQSLLQSQQSKPQQGRSSTAATSLSSRSAARATSSFSRRFSTSHICRDASSGVRLVESGTYSSPRPSHNCGQLRLKDVGTEVTLCGWLSSHRPISQHLAFLVVRDGFGSTQVKLEITGDNAGSVSELLRNTPLESVICIRGKVIARPENMRNSEMATGEIEIDTSSIEVLNRAVNVPIPFQRDSPDTLSEEARLRYRYLELRQPYLQRNIRLRSKITQIIRQSLINNGFCEIETPTLFRKTSEGAKEFLVPTRTPGKFYVLTQSPQQYKQMLMASGFDRYFQIARCYRDENLRADRQPEFTQVDLEMAFIQQEDIMKVIEDLLAAVWKEALGFSIQMPLPRRTFRWCMDNYGSDKPDTRYELLLKDITDVFKNTAVGVLQNKLAGQEIPAHLGSFGVKGINIIGLSDACNDKELDNIQKEAKLNSNGRGVLMMRVGKGGQLKSAVAKHMSAEESAALIQRFNAKEGDLIMISAGLGDEPLQLLGKMRIWCANILIQKKLLIIPADRFDFFWVIDFPLFTWEDGVMASTHHPFTAPVSEDAHMLLTHPERVRGQHYDIVLNGIELGGGSIRIHRAEEQLKVFRDVLKLGSHKTDEFSHLLEALSQGAPPHGGIALGLDRLVAQALGAKSLREVLAFPKTGTGAELLTGSPSELSPAELKELMDTLNIAATAQKEAAEAAAAAAAKAAQK